MGYVSFFAVLACATLLSFCPVLPQLWFLMSIVPVGLGCKLQRHYQESAVSKGNGIRVSFCGEVRSTLQFDTMHVSVCLVCSLLMIITVYS